MNLSGWILHILLPLVALGAWAALFRLLRGPTQPDRVIAIDFLALEVIGGSAIYAIETGDTSFLSAAVVLALISFIGTVAYAFYFSWEDRR